MTEPTGTTASKPSLFRFDEEGYGIDGRNFQGYTRDGYKLDEKGVDRNKDGWTRPDAKGRKFDVEGFDQNGFDEAGFNRQERDANGYHKTDGTNIYGQERFRFDRYGRDFLGHDRYWRPREDA